MHCHRCSRLTAGRAIAVVAVRNCSRPRRHVGQLLMCRATPGQGVPAGNQQHHQQFQELLSELQQLSFQELQQLCDDSDATHRAFSASFLFWLSAQEKAAAGQQKQLASLAAQLVYMREQAEAAASRRLLPSLASSLAYSNYSSWRQQHPDQELPDVAPGISVTDLYKAAEREEAKLKQWQSPQRQASSLDSFVDSSGYKQLAAQAIERAHARFLDYDDDFADDVSSHNTVANASGDCPRPDAPRADVPQQQQQQRVSPAAVRVLQELLLGCSCREERATLLPEAFMPPGLQVPVGGGSSGGAPARVVTTPQRVVAVIQQRLQRLPEVPASGTAGAGSSAQPHSQEQQLQQLQAQQLPSGELLQQVLLELQEDIQEFDRHVYSQMSAQDIWTRL